MKVLYFHQHFNTPSGTVGIRSYEMARKLIARGHAVTMVCGSYKGSEIGLTMPFDRGRRRGKVEGIDIIEFDLAYSNSDGFMKRSMTFIKFAVRSIGLAFTEQYDVVFATTTPLTAGIPGIMARWLRGKPFVFEVRDLWPELPKAMGVIRNPVLLWALSVLEWTSYHSANRLIGLSPGIVAGIAKRGVPLEHITLIPNGCDLDFFDPFHGDVLRPAGTRKDDFLAVFTGAHGIANGLDAVLNAAGELKKKERSDIKIIFIGDGKLKPALIRRVADENLDNCLFLDPVPKRKLTAYLRGADAGLMILDNVPAFYYGTSPNKFFDYIASGLPVLNNYPGWLAGMIRANSCGSAVEPENPKAFAMALEEMADNPVLTKRMGKNSRMLAEREFDRAKLAETFCLWLEGVGS